MRSCYREKLYECGDYLEVNIYPVYRKAYSRRKKSRPTRETQQKLNEIYAENKFIRLCNANFTKHDLKVELTYKPEYNPADEEEAAHQLRNFLRRLKNYRSRRGLPELKYVATTERGSRKGRYHHHLIINGGIPLGDLVSLWGRGRVGTDILQFNENDIADLARYMIKQSAGSGKKWNASKNLIHPQAKKRDGRLSKRRVAELARDTEDSREFENRDLHVYVNSGGGDVFGGLAIYNILSRYPGKKVAHIDGIAASIAGIIPFACDKVVAPKYAQLMLHKPWTSTWGNANDLKKAIEALNACEQSIINVYKEHAINGTTEEKIKSMIDRETWLSAEQAAEFFAIELLDTEPVAACVSDSYKLYKNIPEALIKEQKQLSAVDCTNSRAEDQAANELRKKKLQRSLDLLKLFNKT